MVVKNVLLNVLPLLLGAGIAAVVYTAFSNKRTNFEEAALGEETSSFKAIGNGFPIHNYGYDPVQDSLLLVGWQQRDSKPVIFFIGNSQTHGINRMKPGDVNYVEMLHRTDAVPGYDVVANSIPNGNLQEFYLLYAHYAEIYPIRMLFVPVFMDDLRETGIRDFYFGKMTSAPALIRNESIEAAKKITSEIAHFQHQETATGDLAALDKTTQALSEAYLNRCLNQNWPAWNNREQIRGDLFGSLYQFRNTALGINAQTRRKMVPGNYQDNFAALEALLRLTRQYQSRVVLYIPPFRNDVSSPYDPAEYARFKEKVQALSQKYDAGFANLEGIIPGPQWGMKASTNASGKPEYDFMHFTAEGHRLLANALRPLLSNPPAK